MTCIVVYGNSGSGKTTMARELAAAGLAHLDLDLIAWDTPGVRRPLSESVTALEEFVATHPDCVIEGCYADLVEAALPWCSELRFLNPGVEACLRNCRARPWEPEKYASAAEQDERLAYLLEWVAQYGVRDDEYSLRRHREVFAGFGGPRREYTAADLQPVAPA
jgi:adenylate kinase family enzyme